MPLTLITGPANSGKARVVLDALRALRARGEEPLLVVPTHADAARYRDELVRGVLAPGGGLAREGRTAGDGHAREGLTVRVERFEGLLDEVVRRAGSAERPLGRHAREQVLAAVLSRLSSVATRARAQAAADGASGEEDLREGAARRGAARTREGAVREGTTGEGAARTREGAAREGASDGEARPGAVRALAALVAELEVERVPPARLRAALGAWAAADPAIASYARHLPGLYEEYLRALGGLTPARASPERRAARALDALRRAPALWGATPVLLYGFDDFTALQLDTLETLGSVVGAPVTVTLAYEPGRVAFASRGATFQRLLPLAAEHRLLEARAEHYAPAARLALHHLERSLFEPAPSVSAPEGTVKSQGELQGSLFEPAWPAVSAGGAVRLLEGGGPRAELELVAEELAALLARGWAPGEIAVAHRSPESVAELLGEVFRARDIPYALTRRVRFAHTALGRALLGLLAASFAQEREHGLGDRGPGDGLVGRGSGLGGGAPGDGLVGRESGLSGGAPGDGLGDPGREHGLGHLLAWLRAPGVLSHPELADALERQARRQGAHTVAQARALWEATHWPLDPLDRMRDAAARGPAALLARTAHELGRMAAPQPYALPAETRALAVAQAALGELLELARCAPELAPGPRALLATLRGLELVVEEGTPGAAAVAVLDPLALRARRVRALFLCGLQEGVFPAPVRPEPLLSAEARRELAVASGLRLGVGGDSEQALAAERYLLYAAVSRPEELLVLSWHLADDDGVAETRSLFVDDVCDLFSCDLLGARTRRALGEVGAAGDLDGAVPGGIAPLRHPQVLAELRERPWSASSLQTWAGCPVRWFVESLLGAESLEPDAEPLARGGLAHVALRDVLTGLRRETGSARLTPELLPRARELLHAALTAHAPSHPLSTAPERVPGAQRRLEADLERYLAHAAGAGRCEARGWNGGVAGAGRYEARGSNGAVTGAGRCEPNGPHGGAGEGRREAGGSSGADGPSETPLEPTHLELSFGFPEEPGALPALDLGEGVRLRGFIDRVDLAPGGEAVVYDYKGARVPPPDRWLPERSFQVALYMRAAETLLGTPVAGGFYQPLAGRDLRARGVLAEGEGVELRCVRGDARPPAAVRELVDEVVAAAGAAAKQARAGALQARPGTCGFGDGACRYPSICRYER